MMSEVEPLWPSQAWIEIEGSESARHGIGRGIVRIGREGDNDICLTDMTVHRYHAAIHRTDDAEYVITDLSSADGNGVAVNGQPVSEARLADGDTIVLGRACLKFIAKPA
jgi:pSer/pThr/pTyr-binding forkhead associated (FHA) protein